MMVGGTTMRDGQLREDQIGNTTTTATYAVDRHCTNTLDIIQANKQNIKHGHDAIQLYFNHKAGKNKRTLLRRHMC